MKYILDTHLLLWSSSLPKPLPPKLRRLIEDPEHELFFSAASLWEIVIKNGLGRSDFQVNAHVLLRSLLDHGYCELAVTGYHVVGVGSLPPIHKDPFDRILVAQALHEGMILLTTDKTVAEYQGPIQFFKT